MNAQERARIIKLKRQAEILLEEGKLLSLTSPPPAFAIQAMNNLERDIERYEKQLKEGE